jgi:hypothetical protein
LELLGEFGFATLRRRRRTLHANHRKTSYASCGAIMNQIRHWYDGGPGIAGIQLGIPRSYSPVFRSMMVGLQQTSCANGC